MKPFLKVLILFIGLFLIKNYSHCQENDLTKKHNVNDFIKVDKIKGVEIYDSWTGKKWKINETSLNLVKSILQQSFVTQSLLLKPGHLSIKFLGAFDYSNYDTYMYSDAIYFDPYYDPNTSKPIKNIQPFAIMLKTDINWAKLK